MPHPSPAPVIHSTTLQELAGLRGLVEDLRQPRPALYALDIGVSALLGWAAFVLAVYTSGPWMRITAAVVSVFAAYRALAFIHELFHQHAMHRVRHFWHAVIGVPLLLPLLLYLPIHQAHHNANTYGTPQDGEYDHFVGRQKFMLLKLFALNALLPLALLFRFGVLTPLAAVVPAIRVKVIPQFLHLALRVPFVAPELSQRHQKEALRVELACMLFAWLVVAGWSAGWHDHVYAWAILVVSIGTLNTARAAASTHLYDERLEGRATMAQVLDSTNVVSRAPLTLLLCPAGLQFHALHHMFPHLPYHNLRTAHERLLAHLPASSDYHLSTAKSLYRGLRRLWPRQVAPRRSI